MKIALCILALNELECLKVIFPKIQAPTENTGYSAIYAIDGGSTDGTKEFFKLHNIEIIQQRRRGRGEAIKAAIEQIDADAFLFFSPDGNEDVLDLFRFEEYLKQGADLVIATRMVNGAFNEEDIHWCRPRKWVNLAFNFLANAFFNRSGVYVTDSINGYRAITKLAAKKLDLSASNYTIEFQMTIRALKKNMSIVEFPTIEGQRVAGETAILSFPAGINFIKRLILEILGF